LIAKQMTLTRMTTTPKIILTTTVMMPTPGDLISIATMRTRKMATTTSQSRTPANNKSTRQRSLLTSMTVLPKRRGILTGARLPTDTSRSKSLWSR